MDYIKIAIIGAGPSGLACAKECENLGVIPHIFERDAGIGWVWPSINCWMNMLESKMKGDIINYLQDTYGIYLKPLHHWNSVIMKSAGNEVRIDGNLGYFIPRGRSELSSLEAQLYSDLKQVPIHFNTPALYKDLAKKYDYVFIATAKDNEARDLGVWNDHGVVHVRGAVVIGKFETGAVTLYFNTDYIKHGYARITPFSPTRAILGYYNIGSPSEKVSELFEQFIIHEGLSSLEYIYKFSLPPYTMGSVSSFQIGNILLGGSAAGLTDRLMGCGGIECMISGILAARAMIQGQDYNHLVQPLQNHIENISAFREPVNSLDNQGFDRLLGILGLPGIKQALYNSGINFTDTLGWILKKL